MTIVEAVAVKRGVHLVKVNPNNTSQDCSGCRINVRKDLSLRWHSCRDCYTELERDINAAINLLKRAIADLKTVGLIVSACGGDSDSPLLKQETKEMLTGFELTLF